MDISCGVKIGQNITHVKWVQSQKSPSSLRNVTLHADTITRRNRDCAPAWCVTAWYLFTARALSSFCKWSYPDNIINLFCILKRVLRHLFLPVSVTNCLHFSLELWSDTGAWILDKLLGLSRQWLTSYSNKHTYMYMINTIQPTDLVIGKLSKNHYGSLKYSTVGSMSFWCATSTIGTLYTCSWYILTY